MSDPTIWKNAQEKEERHWEGAVNALEQPSHLLTELAYYASAIEFAQAEIAGRQIRNALEIGVGPVGIGTLPFIVPAAEITGVDPLPPMAFRCSDSALDQYAQGLRAKVIYKQIQGERLPFDDGAYDLVGSVNVLDHTENPDQILNEMVRILKPGGLFLLAVNTFSLAGRLKFESWRKLQPAKDIFVMHPYSYGHTDLKRELARRNLRIVVETGHERPLLGKMTLSKFLAEKPLS